jgi:hypothetical protein
LRTAWLWPDGLLWLLRCCGAWDLSLCGGGVGRRLRWRPQRGGAGGICTSEGGEEGGTRVSRLQFVRVLTAKIHMEDPVVSNTHDLEDLIQLKLRIWTTVCMNQCMPVAFPCKTTKTWKRLDTMAHQPKGGGDSQYAGDVGIQPFKAISYQLNMNRSSKANK